MTLTAIHAESIYYPVTYKGSFESSDAVLNRIWETGAYTAHLSMQDGIWDAPKRDRGRWAGDLDVEGKTILTAFGDTWLLEDTLDRLASATSDDSFVNGIPGYSAQWIAGLATLYLHSGDRELLAKQQEHLRHILATMDGAVEPNGRLKHTTRGWGFVDWAPGLFGSSPDVEMGTALEFARAYKMAGEMLKDLGDSGEATEYASQAAKMVSAAAEVGYGSTLQVNSMAVLTAPDAASAQAIATKALAEIRQEAPNDPRISPYFNAYLLDALARAGREKQAQDWMRTYWGGMLAEGATSFWESYDLRWPKTNFHLSLEADGTSGYFVSLAHGWSSGPTAWLAEQVLGVEPTSPGYTTVAIHPRLSGLDWAKGTVPTPHGTIAVSMSRKELQITLPTDVKTATVTLTEPGVGMGMGQVLLNGKAVPPGNPLSLTAPGSYTIRWQ